ncbi:unnamed protein product [Ostreobium quekettii]|uniref:Bromo domain-containing protein n=1 Tax=Ostreobium quekettii TaxID=121088 RepID=A0A8S1IKT8_9CHLO|nr:unnamed protein product [Ostreobium quekettii]|eukprot:evm.model.scf_66EXC.16 EVM.evm.TU.scf_66EXC.16   scf_66EXC:141255-145140(+)
MKRSREAGGAATDASDRAEKRRQLDGLLAQIREQDALITRLKADRGWLTGTEAPDARPDAVAKTWQRIHSQLTSGCLKPAQATAQRPAQARGDQQEMRPLWKKCETILNNIRRHRLAGPFLHPVDPVRAQVPDYYNVIKHPMDLGTVGERLELRGRGGQRGYASPLEFRDDMRLVWANCREYNPPGHVCRKMGDQMSVLWESRWLASGVEARLREAAGQCQHTSEPRQAPPQGPGSGPDSSAENHIPPKKRSKAAMASLLQKVPASAASTPQPRPKSAVKKDNVQAKPKAASRQRKLQEASRPAMKPRQHPAVPTARGTTGCALEAGSGAADRPLSLQEFVSLDKELQKLRAVLLKGNAEDKGGFGQLRRLSAEIGCSSEAALCQIWDAISRDPAATSSPEGDLTLDVLAPKTVEKLAGVLRKNSGHARSGPGTGTGTASRLQRCSNENQ